MASRQITCINKTNRPGAHERISHIGGYNEDNTHWKLSLADAVSGMENGTHAFHFEGSEGDLEVVIARTAKSGVPYLKTTADSQMPDVLLSLPEC